MMASNPQTNLMSFKVILFGDSGVEKTSIANRIAHQQFLSSLPSTIAVGNYKVVIPVGNTQVELKLWDTAGQERYKSIIPMFKRETSVCIIVCSVDSPDSINHINDWKKIIEAHMVSAKTNDGIVELFDQIAKELISSSVNCADNMMEQEEKPIRKTRFCCL
ncbi:Ras family protein [Trichomonas vaginalis G3]|uniref:Ras family protein n=1 Tax=Trichomonas vaginalis (strain ATCC PRA-98 / G3) TaxID=412133 RepID=A2EE95_TRIV3|nr:retrograde vesicle-mediated transport, Golgi to ER [Trichomonas vaginalis G3]EAY08993.1 Ras family protein [Trichomonas vaginalis G3]KAI5496298.1 retrograde vesicle-mediated transport, Golgi to ER [Trichomonas vaginalis G3]|eukprot:XP_001321216.1 Ras family protein [Trichomonas vaginalis G3]